MVFLIGGAMNTRGVRVPLNLVICTVVIIVLYHMMV